MQDATREPSPGHRYAREPRGWNAARLVLIVAGVLVAPIVLQVLRRQVSVSVLLVVLGVAALALAVAAVADRR